MDLLKGGSYRTPPPGSDRVKKQIFLHNKVEIVLIFLNVTGQNKTRNQNIVPRRSQFFYLLSDVINLCLFKVLCCHGYETKWRTVVNVELVMKICFGLRHGPNESENDLKCIFFTRNTYQASYISNILWSDCKV